MLSILCSWLSVACVADHGAGAPDPDMWAGDKCYLQDSKGADLRTRAPHQDQGRQRWRLHKEQPESVFAPWSRVAPTWKPTLWWRHHTVPLADGFEPSRLISLGSKVCVYVFILCPGGPVSGPLAVLLGLLSAFRIPAV